MDHVSRPMIALLAATVLFALLWFVALKPGGSSSSGASSQGLGAYQGDINAAHHAVGTSNAANAAAGGASQTTPASTTPAAHPAASPTPGRPVHVSSSPTQRYNAVERALLAHKVIALLFYNPAGADDVAVKQELAAVPDHGGKVFKLALPIGELAKYIFITNQVMVGTSPTLVLINPEQQASTIVGFADRFEISQRVADALASK